MAYHELIETLWNVNSVINMSYYLEVAEVIETLWNVNKPSRIKERYI